MSKIVRENFFQALVGHMYILPNNNWEEIEKCKGSGGNWSYDWDHHKRVDRCDFGPTNSRFCSEVEMQKTCSKKGKVTYYCSGVQKVCEW
jgi:hypothetical protein